MNRRTLILNGIRFLSLRRGGGEYVSECGTFYLLHALAGTVSAQWEMYWRHPNVRDNLNQTDVATDMWCLMDAYMTLFDVRSDWKAVDYDEPTIEEVEWPYGSPAALY